MNQESLEQAAENEAIRYVNQPQGDDANAYEFERQAFVAGAQFGANWQRDNGGWIKTSEQLPAQLENKSYSQVWCLVFYKRNVCILVFNHEHKCWDAEDGDDYECDIYDVEFWMPLPQKPKQ